MSRSLNPAATLRQDFAGIDRDAVFALLYTAFALTAINYLRAPAYLERLVGPATQSRTDNLPQLLWWVALCMLFYFVIPAAVVRGVQRRPLSAIGVGQGNGEPIAGLFATCLIVVLPLVIFFSSTPGFAAKYPFLHVYNGAPYAWQTLLLWEAAYLLQFVGLEFFFRGFLVHSLKPVMGLYAVFVATMPYVMIHWTKPMPEAFAAIVTGIFLGWVSYRTRTIWLGVALHCTVALAMDVLALLHKGMLVQR